MVHVQWILLAAVIVGQLYSQHLTVDYSSWLMFVYSILKTHLGYILANGTADYAQRSNVDRYSEEAIVHFEG